MVTNRDCESPSISSGAVDGIPMANLQLGLRGDATPSISTNFPIEIQKLTLCHLDWQSMIQLRATNRHYCNIITNECQDIWKARHDARWSNGKRRYSRCWDDFEDWSRRSGWKIHPEGIINGNWYGEFLRRSRLDESVLPRLMELNVEQSRSNYTWYILMSDGEDIIDRLKSVIVQQRKISNSSLDLIGEKVLTGISRCVAYQEWKFLHDPTVLPRTRLEDGAITIAKFYDKHDEIMESETIHSWEDIVLKSLDNFADIVKKRLDKRSCVQAVQVEYPILEVMEEMKYLFRTPSPSDDDHTVPTFRGNADDYYNHTNSLINHCIRLKTGIPITLAIIYSAIVRRVCDVEMDIIGLPGHIVVGVPAGADNTSRAFVDPFHGARILSYADCQDIVARYNMAFNEAMIHPIANDDCWQRMIRNLIHSHSMQALADDNDDRSNDDNHHWKIAMPLKWLLSDYAPRITSFRELVAAPGWCPQFC